MVEADGSHSDRAHSGFRASMALGALGIVYGDIGTSPLYALKEAIRAAGIGGGSREIGVIGSVSIILWALVLVVSIKYAVLILRADNRGEGGVVAMLALLHARDAKPGTWRAGLLLVGLLGAALLYGDGAITPAVSVLSAVEGLEVDAPRLTPLVLPITLIILAALFLVQRQGTALIGRVFGPIMMVWFILIALLGLRGIAMDPSILKAVNPFYAYRFMHEAGLIVTFGVLGAAFLAVTGGEAMYADMGHFGRSPIRLAWFVVVLPALVLNYLGQGGLVLADPSAASNPFYQLSPDFAHYPLVVFATVATVIASQAIISGAFSLTQQTIQLGFLPRMHIRHTASDEIGQIYIPFVNWLLAAATISAVLIFKSSDALAGAYGLAVSLLMVITTFLAALVALQWGYNPLLVLMVNGVFFVVDLVFFGANGIKLLEGGWFPLLLAAWVAFVMLTWRTGQSIVEKRRTALRQPEDDLLRTLEHEGPIRLPGTAVFLTSATHGVPLPLTHFMRYTHALQERAYFLTILTGEVPRVPPEKRLQVLELGSGVTRLTLRYGFMETITLMDDIGAATQDGRIAPVDPHNLSFFLGRETIIPTRANSGMALWREFIFAFVQRNSERSAIYFGVPTDQVVEIGTEIEI